MYIGGKEIQFKRIGRSIWQNLLSNWFLLRPVYYGLPFATLVFYKHPNFQSYTVTKLPSVVSASLLSYEPIITWIAVALSICFLWKSPKAPGLNADTSSQLLMSLDIPVEEKAFRMHEFVKENLLDQNGNIESMPIDIATSKLFSLINPKVQIEKVLESLKDFLYNSTIKTKKDPKIVLFMFSEDSIIESIYWPRNATPRVGFKKLMERQTAVKKAFESGEAVWITDVAKAIPNNAGVNLESDLEFVDPAPDEKKGSILCYPIFVDCLQRTGMVLSIFVKRPGIFDGDNIEYYTEMLRFFEARLKLEYVAYIIMEHANV